MPMPVKSLPVIQRWDCRGCGDCCKTYHVRVTDAERARIEGQGWADDSEMKDVEPVVWDRQLGEYRLNHTAEGACVFYGPDGRCRIHAKFGAAAKPMACRIYPFALVPAGDHWRVGIRFACPSAATNDGRPLPDHAADLREYAGLLEADAECSPLAPRAGSEDRSRSERATFPPPELKPGQAVTWPDLLRFVKAVGDVLAEPGTPIDYRLRKVAALASLCKKSKFDKVTGPRLKEFLDVVTAALDDDAVARAEDVPPPGWIGRVIFRQTLAVYSRKDHGPTPGIAKRSRLTRIKSAWRFAMGVGPVPRLHGLMPETTFADAELPTGPLSKESDALLTRYYRVKVESLQFCGPVNFRQTFWDGLDSLLLTFPAILWLSRVLTTPDRPRDEAVGLALRIVDDNFGFNKLLGSGRQLWATQTLAERGELARLIAWYAR
ncbi:MAG TPA: YkgJ family cysteine cluster protein [Fimbriiglobus sp.]|nr:YkgJ family cysteine cluster protein [Fimbriiglobus sp.]